MDDNPRAVAESLLDEARSDPVRTLATARSFIGALSAADHDLLSVGYRALAIAARYGASMDDSIAHGRRSVSEAEAEGEPALHAQALMTLAGSFALSGSNDLALGALDRAAESSTGHLLAEVEFQRGAVLHKQGEIREARACYSRALPVFEEHGDRESIAMTLNNRAMLDIDSGVLSEARRDLERARRLDLELGHLVDAAYADHNLGILAAYQGDIPEALRRFDDSEGRLEGMVEPVAEVQVSRCEVLLSAGLFREALALGSAISHDLHRHGLKEDEAEARLVVAQAALLAGEIDVGLRWAERAAELFAEQGRETWAAIGRQLGVQARYQANSLDSASIAESRSVATLLENKGWPTAAFRARLSAGLIAARLGMADEARGDLARVSGEVTGPVEIRLQAWLARAMLRTMDGDHRGADAAVRAGLDLLDSYQAALGATDIRVGIERHARELGDLGLRMALESGRPRRVFRWMERTRGRALMHRPVAPPTDHELAVELAGLRQVSAELRRTQDRAVDLMKRQLQLQESIRNRARLTRGTGVVADGVGPGPLLDSLGERTLLEMASLDGTLVAVLAGGGRFRLRELGPESEVMRELESLRFSMRRLARGHGSTGATLDVAHRIDEMVFGRLGLGDGPVVIVPAPRLYAAPWWSLPTCRSRPVTISPSAGLWYRANNANPVGGQSLFAAGPDLGLADAEVKEVADLYTKATVLSSAESQVETVHSHLDGASVAHIASHAFFQFENPMFSSLRLADGDLNVYDIERLGTAPALVVLSACDSGFTDTHAGEELMGLSSALLSTGTKSIIASVGLVPDSAATKELMTALHRGLISGIEPSHALHQAQSQIGNTPDGYIAASSFICIGAG